MNRNSDSFDDEHDWDEQRSLRESMRHDDQTAVLSSSRKPIYFDMPPQLHPACSMGVRRVSSCYFSLASSNDNQSMTGLLPQTPEKSQDGIAHVENKHKMQGNESNPINNPVDLFYHDILMHVFTFMDPSSLLSFSETARRPNFEVFYFLQLQLQQALLLDEDDENCNIDNSNSNRIRERMDKDSDSIFKGSASILSRVARSDMGKARELVEEYQESNLTLRSMPLSYSLAYVRHYLSRNGFHKMVSNNSDCDNTNHHSITSEMTSKISSSQTLASAAIFVTVVGAATLVSSSDAPILFHVGFVGSLMRAISDTERGNAMREKAGQIARHSQDRMNFVLPSLYELKNMLQETMSSNIDDEKQDKRQPLFLDPYDHLPSEQGSYDINIEDDDREEKKRCDHDDNNKQLRTTDMADTVDVAKNSTVPRKVPSGCIGAYSRAIHKAANFVTSHAKAKRKLMFESLSSHDKRQRSLEFLRSCASNDTIDQVKEMISVMDVNRFYVGDDGNETCALHTAAFNGADNIVEFLCAGIDSQDSQLDGGLCDVNAKDNNGWTALHFAAGANSISAIRVLAAHGAVLNVEAHNGYTPLSWAVRLSNEGVADELKELMSRLITDQSGTWIYSKPLVSIANHLFSFIPTQ